MKLSIIGSSLLFAVLTTFAQSQIVPSSYVFSSGSTFDGSGVVAADSVMLELAGTAASGISRSESVIWRPDGTPEILGNLPMGGTVYMPSQGAGQYWLQFRLVDSNNNFADQWISFTVQAGFLVPQASVAQNDATTFLLVQSAQTSAGVAWTENVIWRPDGLPEILGDLPLGSVTYAATAGPGVYSYQFRIVDTNLNYKDQWLTFTVNP